VSKRQKPAEFTEAERRAVHDAARAVWQSIGPDCLAPCGEDDPENPPRNMRRSEVIEVVADASRLEQQIRADGRAAARRAARDGAAPSLDYEALARRVDALGPREIEALLRPAFPHQWYGL
jgi:hypothetical protein